MIILNTLLEYPASPQIEIIGSASGEFVLTTIKVIQNISNTDSYR